ncbi:hypothetical protein DNTS_027528 [Danionella cerebrum]|uniref:Uncharacterized protein n=1 Tax=Danionella cerebrum TaxID=2873325 RepID=A0A553R2P9_9TELE|nr:hypothetical protein DNTS_027528 [Danionella translucida]
MWTGHNDGDQQGHVSARMETSLPLGTTSISVSQQQAPKKFAPVVAPKPKFNPYKQPGDSTLEDDYPLPPPPAIETSGLSSSSSFPPPPPVDDASLSFQIKGPEKTLEERRSSLDAEIDSLTSILADLESSSPYKHRTPQLQLIFARLKRLKETGKKKRAVSASEGDKAKEGASGNIVPKCPVAAIDLKVNMNSASPAAAGSNAPVTGYRRMVIPNQPPLTATKKNTPKPQGSPNAAPPASSSPRPTHQPAPQPVPASYTTASTPSQPTFNVQVRAAQPGPQQQPFRGPGPVQFMHAQARGPDFAFGPPQPGFCPAPSGGFQDPLYGGAPGYGAQNTWRPEPAHHIVPAPTQVNQTAAPKKTYITDPPSSLAPYGGGPSAPHKNPIEPV